MGTSAFYLPSDKPETGSFLRDCLTVTTDGQQTALQLGHEISLDLSRATWKGPDRAQRQQEAALLPCRAALCMDRERPPHTENCRGCLGHSEGAQECFSMSKL